MGKTSAHRQAALPANLELDLKEALRQVIPAKRELLKRLRNEHGRKVIGEIKVENVIGGMR
jgi:citrate synthase